MNNYSIDLANSERHDEALETAKRSVELHRELRDAVSALYTPDLANAPNTLSEVLRDADRSARQIVTMFD